jgi:hypothetical protein
LNLYLSLGHIWTGTQADARAAQGGKDFLSVEVPTDKAGLLEFLNNRDRIKPEPTPPPSLVAVGPYRNGDPTLITNGSRDPGARA